LIHLVFSGYGCTSGGETDKPAEGAPVAAKPTAAAKTPFVPLDACTLLTKSDVESIAGKAVLDGRKEELGPLVSCGFGDPAAPQVEGRAISQVLSVSVMTGEDGAYYAGPVAQVKEAFQMARGNAASAEAVTGVGEAAYWDKILRKLSFVQGRYLVDIDVQSGDDSLKVARAAAAKALEKLPH
jgi:hypothetical protein